MITTKVKKIIIILSILLNNFLYSAELTPKFTVEVEFFNFREISNDSINLIYKYNRKLQNTDYYIHIISNDKNQTEQIIFLFNIMDVPTERITTLKSENNKSIIQFYIKS